MQESTDIDSGMEKPTFKFALREDLKDDLRFLPTRAEPTATGFDVRAAQKDKKPLTIRPFEHVKIPLGFRAFLPDNYWYELKPRSSTFAKKHLHALYGVIDESFEGQLVLAAQYIPHMKYDQGFQPNIETYLDDNELVIEFGEAIGQIVPIRRQEMIVESVSNEEYEQLTKDRGAVRRNGGFGSTDKTNGSK